jgi:hypothetical protein
MNGKVFKLEHVSHNVMLLNKMRQLVLHSKVFGLNLSQILNFLGLFSGFSCPFKEIARQNFKLVQQNFPLDQ